jgi:hypothetical protein
MSLTICLLTRNEEHNLPRVLASVAGLGAEVLVGDVASTDRTAEVAAAHGARVCPLPWHEDFAEARNALLAQTGGDWVFWLNPDEELAAGRELLPAALNAGPEVLGYVVRVHELPHADRLDAFTETLQLRLYRRRPDLHYLGRLHPHFVTPPEEIARREGKQVPLLDVTVRHHAYLSTLTPDKLRWAARLLELELRDRPGQLDYLIHHGRTLLLLNDPRGHEVLAEAAEAVLARRGDPTAPTPTVGLLLEYALTVSPEQSRSRLSREEAGALAVRWFPNTPPVLWRVAEYLFSVGQLRGAAESLERLLRCGRTGAYDRALPFSPDIIGEAALLNLGVCWLRMGARAEAEQCLRPLLSSPAYREQAARALAAGTPGQQTAGPPPGGDAPAG